MCGLDMEISGDEKKIAKMSSFKKKAIGASNRFKNSFKRKTRRTGSRIVSEPVEDDINAEDLQSIKVFRQHLVDDGLLLSRHDDHHMMLRFLFLHILSD